MKAYFFRKVEDIAELRDKTATAKRTGSQPQEYTVTEQGFLDHPAFRAFTADFFDVQPWLGERDGGSTSSGAIRCKRVVDLDTGERVLVNNEGYDYARYTAIEE